MSTGVVITYHTNPLVSEYVRRRNRHVELAERGIARSGSCVSKTGRLIVWRVDPDGTYVERERGVL